jgi:hypothetical protein
MGCVVIVECRFVGLFAAKSVRRAPVEVVVVDRTNHHLSQPLLYQVATGVLSEGDIAPPIRVSQLVNWVENGQAPTSLNGVVRAPSGAVTRHGRSACTRRWPPYNGQGPATQASSFRYRRDAGA